MTPVTLTVTESYLLLAKTPSEFIIVVEIVSEAVTETAPLPAAPKERAVTPEALVPIVVTPATLTVTGPP